ncbi:MULTISPECIES: tripartite tricarboxylate transporter substrate-binding protein [unclassified Beijerinckia]|uniref:Bug family tripartite tricarboxylate transporter substrate binding protein n=1 Tax=unclassified Beijerinckia TaxID=2638183 RepID=UPI000897DE16|nr:MULTISPECIES: tripartite tricarboxylate transporter substrate-binding protein [unclassified Beijerinckia]MDH7797651.1 tripartite-type tricarboxylate transporter receptor subunit TctC [Beijerinckia sp. GAS462]SEC93750.1 Tripartite-type tricarboxylate transporter, receptor component TctC [Beijerinckia sp. 28-YEA-48]
MKGVKGLYLVVLAWFLAVLPSALAAQEWPTRYVRMVVAASAGSAPDVICRLIGDRLGQRLGQQVVIENQNGAGGNLGATVAARAAPDGYSLFCGQAAPLALNQHLFKTLNFNVARDFDPITLIGMSPMVIAVNAKRGIKTLPELIAIAKADPGKLSFATSGTKNVPHLTAELLKSSAGIRMTQVPYSATTQGAMDAMTGVVDMMIDGIPAVQAHVQSGSLIAVAVSAPKRLPGLERVPAISETLPGFNVSGWFGLVAPKGTPPAIIKRINDEMNVVLSEPNLIARLSDLGVYPDTELQSPVAFGTFLQSQAELYGRIAQMAGFEKE